MNRRFFPASSAGKALGLWLFGVSFIILSACGQSKVLVFCPLLAESVQNDLSGEKVCQAYRAGVRDLLEEKQNETPYNRIDIVWGDEEAFLKIYKQLDTAGIVAVKDYIASKKVQAAIFCEIKKGPARSGALYSVAHLCLPTGHVSHDSRWTIVDQKTCYSSDYWRAKLRKLFSKFEGVL